MVKNTKKELHPGDVFTIPLFCQHTKHGVNQLKIWSIIKNIRFLQMIFMRLEDLLSIMLEILIWSKFSLISGRFQKVQKKLLILDGFLTL